MRAYFSAPPASAPVPQGGFVVSGGAVMARARNIKPGFFTNADLLECQPLARLLFAGLWCEADRRGVLEDRPKTLKIKLLPGDNCDVEELLGELAAHGFIRRYEAQGTRCILVNNFDKHQNPHINEHPNTLPSPDEHGASTGAAPEQHQSNPADSLNVDSLSTDSGLRIEDCGDPPAPRPKSPNASWSLLETLCDELGQDATVLSKPAKDKQLAAAKRLADTGFTEADIRSMVRWLAPQPWVSSGVDLFLIEKQRGKWELAGKPDRAKAPPPATIRGPNGKDIGLSTEQLFAMAQRSDD